MVTCIGCKRETAFTKGEYLAELAYRSGISLSENSDEIFEALLDWKIVEEKDRDELQEDLTYGYLYETLERLLEEDPGPDKREGIVSKEEALAILDAAVEKLNGQIFENSADFREKEGIQHFSSREEVKGETGDLVYIEDEEIYGKIVRDGDKTDIAEADLEDVFSSFSFSGSGEISFEDSEVIPAFPENRETHYVNTSYKLLAAEPLKKTFEFEGYKVSLDVSAAGISVEAYRKKNGVKTYADFSLYSLHPVYKFDFQDGNKNAYLKLSYKTAEKAGIKAEKYEKGYLKLKDLDPSDFLSMVKSMIGDAKNDVDISIPICTIRTPIQGVPFVNLNTEVTLNISAEGKIEISLSNKHLVGFEIRDGKFRLIHDLVRDLDGIVEASAKLTAGVNFNVTALKQKVMDLDIEGGIKTKVDSVLHLYDQDGTLLSEKSELDYSALKELSRENSDVKLCGDLSLYWLLKLGVNTSKTFLHRLGFGRSFYLLDEDDQVFGNRHHLEDGHFVDRCTRKPRAVKDPGYESIRSDKLLLKKSSVILRGEETYAIEIKSLPESYTYKDLRYESEDPGIAAMDAYTVVPVKKGNTRILVSTEDGKYSVYLNVLVSD